MPKIIYQATIPGRCFVKKNTQRVVGFGKRKRAIYSPQYVGWARIAAVACKSAMARHYTSEADNASLIKPREEFEASETFPITQKIQAEFKFYFLNRRAEPDVSNLVEGIADVLQTSGVIKDDKLIMRFSAEKAFGEDPRTEVKLFKWLGAMK